MRRTARRCLALLTLLSVAILWPAAAASAHPLGNFTVNLYSGIHVVPGEIRIDYVVDMAEIPTFQEKPSIDTDGDGTMSAAELASWATGEGPALADNLILSVAGR
jgi:nickel/cobalt transporter (NicO) family protein